MRVPEWFAATGVAPPFATDAEVRAMYDSHIESVTEPQYRGIRLGNGPNEVVVLRERPRVDPVVVTDESDGGNPFFEWVPGDPGTVMLARQVLIGAVGPASADHYAAEFADKIISRLSRHEWTLTDAFVQRWVDLMEGR